MLQSRLLDLSDCIKLSDQRKAKYNTHQYLRRNQIICYKNQYKHDLVAKVAQMRQSEEMDFCSYGNICLSK